MSRFFVVNEHAGNGKGRRVFQRIRPLLDSGDEVEITRGVGDGQRIAGEAARAGHRLVVAVGGDGTINETVNGLAETGFEAVLGILPAGAANDLPYALGLPSDPVEALAVLRQSEVRHIDLGLVSFDGGRRQRYYVNMLAVGVTGEIAAISQGDKRLGGALTYLGLLLSKAVSTRPWRFQLLAEGDTIIERGVAAHLANGSREGRLFTVVGSAQVDDGLLDMVAVDDVALLRRPVYTLQVLRGRLLEQRGVRHRLVKAATVRATDALPCHMDGEPFLLEPGQEAEVEVRGKALRVAVQGQT